MTWAHNKQFEKMVIGGVYPTSVDYCYNHTHHNKLIYNVLVNFWLSVDGLLDVE